MASVKVTDRRSSAATASKGLAKANHVVAFEDAMFDKIDKQLNSLEKKNRVGNFGITSNFENRMSTNLLSVDLMLGGGIIPGYWYTAFGPEQSAKSTLSMQVMIAAIKYGVRRRRLWDYEGSSGDADYLKGQLLTNQVNLPIGNLFGVRAKDGSWAVNPVVRYYSEDVLETFFDVESSLLRRMPDKFMYDGSWWYGFENDKFGKDMTQGKHDKRMFQQTGLLCVPASDGKMQALAIVDSYGAMNPRAADEDDPSRGMALAARAFSENIKRVLGKLRRKRVSIFGVNQLRIRPAVMFGNPEYETGGEALKFASACRIKMTPRVIPWSNIKGMYEQEDAIGGGTDTYRYVHARTHKNKLASANQETFLRLWTEDTKKRGRGFDPVYDCIAEGALVATNKGLIRIEDIEEYTTDNKTSGASEVIGLKAATRHGYKPIRLWKNKGEKECINVKVNGGYVLTCTKNHKVLKMEGNGNLKWVAAGSLGIDDFVVMKKDFTAVKRQEKEGVEYKAAKDVFKYLDKHGLVCRRVRDIAEAGVRTVYDITVEDEQNFVADGFVVHNCYQYLLQTGQISGQRNKLSINMEEFGRGKALSWHAFKTLVIGDKEQMTKVLRDSNVIKKGEKPFNLRRVLERQMDSGKGMDLYVKQKQAKSSGDDEEED